MRKSPLGSCLSVCRAVVATVCVCVLLCGVVPLRAGNGTWNTTTSGGNWSDEGNWLNGDIASGVDAVANFATLNITTNPTVVYVDEDTTIGTLQLGDTTRTSDNAVWQILSTGNAVLTLETSTGKPVLNAGDMYNGRYSVILASLAGTQGFEKTGSGNLTVGSGNNSRLSGEVVVSAGKLNIQGSMNNVTVTVGASGTLAVGASSGTYTSIAGLNSTGTNGVVTWSSNSRQLRLTGTGSYSYGGKINGATSGSDDVGVDVRLGDGGVQTFTNATTTGTIYGGGTFMNSGTLVSASASTTGTLTPFGTGSVWLLGGTMKLSPNVASGTGAINYTGVTNLVPASTRSVATTFNYGTGTFVLERGNASSITYTIGNTTAAQGAVLVRNGGTGTMVLATSGGIGTLGTTENFVVNGNSGTDGVATLNGMASASVLGRVSLSDADADATFLNYGAVGKTGFSEVTYSAETDINGGTAYTDTRIFQATSGTTNALTADAAVYSLRVDGTTVSGAHTLSIGSNSATNPAAGIILNGGSVTVSTIALGDSPLVIYTNAEGGTISSNITASGTSTSTTPGVAATGPGVLTLTGTNTFHSLAINDGTVSVASEVALGSKNSGVVGAGTITLRNGTLRVTENMSISDRQIDLNGTTAASLNTYGGSVGGTFDVAAGKTLTYTTGSSTTFKKYISGDGSLEKAGAGTMVLAGQQSNIYMGVTIVSEGTLLLNGTAAKNMISSTGNSGDSLDLTDVQVKTGGTLQWGASSNQIIDTAKVALGGGVMDLNGRSEGTAAAAGLGFLNVFGSSTLDFGEGDNANTIRFTSINLHTAGTVLAITNWDGIEWLGAGSERLLFGGLVSEFTGIFGQEEVSFNGTLGYEAVQFDGYYEIVGVPEPGTAALMGVALCGGVALALRRRRAAV